MEKFVKMTNPNYKISPTRVLFKCVSKDLTTEQLRTWTYSQFEGLIKPKKLKTIKLLKDIKIVSDSGQSRGFIFIDFLNSEKALQFVKKIVEHKDDTMAELGNPKGETPIIEFAFDDVKKMRKIEDVKAKQMQEAKENKEQDPEDSKTKSEKKQFQKALQNNRKLMAKKLVADALQQGSEDIAKQALDSINSLRSRGIKHRLLIKIQKRFAHLVPESTIEVKDKPKIEKPANRVKKIEKSKKVVKPDENIMKIKHDVKNKNKKLRREKNQNIDKPDEFEANFIKKVQKKGKWTENA